MRLPTQRQRPRRAEVKTWPSPRSGWIANRNLAQPGAVGPDGTALSGALVLDNVFPTATTARLRRGKVHHADIEGGEVRSVIAYLNGANEKLFAADGNKIVDISNPVPVDVVMGLSGGEWSYVQFASSDGKVWLRMVNGQDMPLVYDGTNFGTVPELTFSAPNGDRDPADLSYVWAYANRLFFVDKDTLNAWYLPAGQIGGELVQLPLGGVFERGGSLLFGAVWSSDSGNQGGLSEQCVFVSTEGEVAVYQGLNPGDPDSWRKVGVYQVGRPLGKRAWFRAGGDIMINTTVGLISLASAVGKDFAALAPTAVSYPIEDAWNDAVRFRGEEGWDCAVWAAQQMAIIVPPFLQQMELECFVVNLRTGAWCRFTGWDIRSLRVFKDRLFFGNAEGHVFEALVGGIDDNMPYTGVYIPLFDDFGTPANRKIGRLARATFRTRLEANTLLHLHKDFVTSDIPPPPDSSGIIVRNEWGSGIWGSSTWGEGQDLDTVQNWVSVANAGTTFAVSLQVTSADVVPLDVELVRIDLTYVTADIVT